MKDLLNHILSLPYFMQLEYITAVSGFTSADEYRLKQKIKLFMLGIVLNLSMK